MLGYRRVEQQPGFCREFYIPLKVKHGHGDARRHREGKGGISQIQRRTIDMPACLCKRFNVVAVTIHDLRCRDFVRPSKEGGPTGNLLL